MNRSSVVPDRGTPMITGIGAASVVGASLLRCLEEGDPRNKCMRNTSFADTLYSIVEPMLVLQFSDIKTETFPFQEYRDRVGLLRYRATLTAKNAKHNLATEHG